MKAAGKLLLIFALILTLASCGAQGRTAEGPAASETTARWSTAGTGPSTARTTAHSEREDSTPEPQRYEPRREEARNTAGAGTLARYEQSTIEGLREREYGGGEIKVRRVLEENGAFTRYLVSYPSDGLTITGMLNVPMGDGPFPVVILNHGYFPIEVYTTGDGSTLAADYLASRGFLTFSPDFRSHADSTNATNQFRAGHVIDALNSIDPIRDLDEAADGKVGMWGHSNGGSITAKSITASDEIGAAVIYAPASSNIIQDYAFGVERAAMGGEQISSTTWPVKPNESPDLYRRLSPLNYLEGVEAPVQLHWGTSDEIVPREWPADLYEGLREAGKTAEFYEYPGQPHSFYGAENELYLRRTAAFFEANL